MGKPLVALDLCARVTRGGLFPDGSDVTAPGNVRWEADSLHSPDSKNEWAIRKPPVVPGGLRK